MLVQLRTGKISLQAFLYSRKVPGIESPSCTCGQREEIVSY